VARGEAVIVAGIGCRAGCDAAGIVALVERAAGLAECRVDVLAAPRFKMDEAGVAAAARLLDVAMVWVEPDALVSVQARCVTRSARVAAAVGVASVAEGCALAVAGAQGRLVLARMTGDGVTCALARGEAS
jgi:cobalamin biosynthesis protein CbiG